MESGNMQLGSSTIRRNHGPGEDFTSSGRGEDDEEALKWAALEKIPTYNRMRKGILTSPSGKANEIDIPHLGFEERKALVDRMLRGAEDGAEKFLLKLKNRIDRVGIDLPTIEVRFEHLKIEAEAYLGSRALPTLLNWTTNIIEGFLTSIGMITTRKTNFSILQNVSGIIKPSRMTLLLGPPSSGKTTLLLALAGRLHPDLKVLGTVTYNGHGMNEFVPQKTAAYISQYDVHIGEMTVRETLAFSARCQGVGTRYDMLAELARREKAANIKPDPDIDVFMKATALEGQEANVVTDYILKILGLEGCADTIVGDDMLRGISGGQKKRVTTGEMLLGPTNAFFMDEISTGLDSSTTFQIVNSIKQHIHILNGTAVVSLLQPAPETYELFDDLILLSDGQIVYQGPREHVLEFFESMGFKCPGRKAIADFLQEVTSRKDQEQYWERKEDPYSFVTVKEFAEAFKSFHVGHRLREELSIPFDRRKNHPAALTTKEYSVKKGELLRACISREVLLMKRNSFVYYFKLTQITFLALMSMTTFLRTKMHHNSIDDAIVYAGALFYANTIIMFNGMIEVSMTLIKLPVFYKQRDLFFYPSWAYALPTWILKIPISLAEVAIWVFMTYYVTGFDPNVGRLFKQYFLFLLVNQMASGLFRAIAAFGREMVVAYSYGSFANLILFTLCGFILSRDKINKLWTWGYWSSPLMYSQNAVAVNELLGKNWRHVLPNSMVSIGVAALKYRGFFAHAYWYWIGVGALIGYVLLFNICYVLALSYLHPLGKTQAVKSEDSVRIAEESTSSQPNKPENIKKEVSADVLNVKKRGMVLAFEPHSITFDEITYAVDMPKEMKMEGVVEEKLVLLKGVSGSFKPGLLTALMGVSGAGKTTLMDVLAGRKTGGYIDGEIKISGYPKKQETFARISGYCEQNDIHSPQVTVYESLVYSAWLRLSPEVKSETKRVFIEEVMELVELNQLRQSLVGLPGINGLSTEQRKRLTIAVELVANPSIIFMDEPTTGLDARAAAIVMRTVRNTVDTGRTVVCTIHQPSIDIFEAFDELLLLKRGGEEIYVGPLGRHSCDLIKYFEEIEGVGKIKDGYNPATWMLEVSTSAQELALGIDFAHVYKKSELYRRNKQLITEYSRPSPSSKELFFPTRYAQPFLIQSMACLWKQHWSYWRNPSYNATRILSALIAALMFGTMFWNLGSKTKTKQDLFNAMGCMYTAIILVGVKNSLSVQPVVGVERTVFYREKAAGMYTALAYSFAQVLIELPYLLVQTMVYGIPTYLMIGFERKFVKFFWYIFYMYFTFAYFTFYGMMTVALTPNYQIASVVSSLFYGVWSLFSGFLIPRPRIPVWWRWYYWACPIAWTLYGLVASQFGDLDDVLDNGETVEQFLRHYFGFRHDFVGVVAVALVGFTLLFAFVFAFSIRVLNFQKR